MRVLLLTQWFQPEPFFKGLPFAKALQARGHTVDVVTGFPNYPGGRLYPGYRVRPYQREIMDGVTVHRSPLFPSHDASGLGRAANYVSFALGATCIGAVMAKRPDVIYAYHPPATVGLPAILLSWRFRCPVVYDIQDLWPDTLRATGMIGNQRVLNLIGRWCQWVYRAVDAVVVLSPGFARALQDRGVPASKTHVIYNWAQEFPQAPQTSRRDTFEVLFAGNMGNAQGLDVVVKAAAAIATTAPRVRFVLMGDGLQREALMQQAASVGATNVEFPGVCPPDVAATRMAAADALLVHLRGDRLFDITIPSKTQAYLEAGRPILMGVSGDAADLVTRAGAGICFTPDDVDSLIAAVRRLAAMTDDERAAMGAKGRDFYYAELSQDIAVGRFEQVFADLVTR